MRILVTGANGMLGTALLPVLQQRHEAWGVDIQDCDITRAEPISALLRDRRPQLVAHLAAYTNVDGAEDNPQLAEQTNSVGTRNIAAACAEIDAAMLYVSTDYVFDGTKRGPYLEDDEPNPASVYGKSKLHGEQHVQTLLKRYFITRTSWLYGPNGKNFVTTILKAAHQQKMLKVVDDQRGSPTFTRHFSRKIAELIDSNAYGIYHTTGSGTCSWFEFARTIVEMWPAAGVEVLPITTSESGRAAKRPANSVLENAALQREHIALMPHWKDALTEYLNEIRKSGWSPEAELANRQSSK